MKSDLEADLNRELLKSKNIIKDVASLRNNTDLEKSTSQDDKIGYVPNARKVSIFFVDADGNKKTNSTLAGRDEGFILNDEYYVATSASNFVRRVTTLKINSNGEVLSKDN